MALYGIRSGEVVRIPVERCSYCGGFAIFSTDEYDHVCELCGRDQNGGRSRLKVACARRRHLVTDETILIRVVRNQFGRCQVVLGCRRCEAGVGDEIQAGREKSGRKKRLRGVAG